MIFPKKVYTIGIPAITDDDVDVGPVRKFMQLVVSGLSKNPHYTVEEKQEHIKWYKDIFSTMSDEEVREMLAKKKRIRGKNKQKAENKSLK